MTLFALSALGDHKSIEDSDFRSRQLGSKRGIGSSRAEVRSHLILTALFSVSPSTTSATANTVNWQNRIAQITSASSKTALVRCQPRERRAVLTEQPLRAVSPQSWQTANCKAVRQAFTAGSCWL